MGLKSGPPRRNYGTKLQKKHNKFKCPYPGCNLYFSSYGKVSQHTKDIHDNTLLGAKYEQESKIEQRISAKRNTSFKETFCKQLDDIINGLTKYCSLTEQGSLIDENLNKTNSLKNEEKIALLVNQNRELDEKYTNIQEKYTILQWQIEGVIEL
ncbi:6159_t:CDS:2 [Racocetra fulgida]|uniref:6159_t:CDS:1 n=1 Tax=Racocetra fulgida TaxID=60492 RepID=A0A9N9A342_9GLOM|nr:6159_t:CDS:2 [Racocetra fulgida]